VDLSVPGGSTKIEPCKVVPSCAFCFSGLEQHFLCFAEAQEPHFGKGILAKTKLLELLNVFTHVFTYKQPSHEIQITCRKPAVLGMSVWVTAQGPSSKGAFNLCTSSTA